MPGATFELPAAFDAFGVVVSDGVMTLDGSNPRLLTSATAAFTQFDVGKAITVDGAGAAGADLETHIARVLSATEVELVDPALTTVASADLSYVQGIYRLSELMEEDVDGNRYQLLNFQRLNIQTNSASPGTIFVGGPYVSPTNAGIELAVGASDNSSIRGVTTSDYLCSDVADALVNIYWIDELNLSTPAP